MECDLLESAKRQAKKKGLDPRAVYCAPDKMAICVETSCSLLPDDPDDGIEVDPAPPSAKDIFYNRLEKRASLVRPQ